MHYCHNYKRAGDRVVPVEKGGTVYNLYMLAREDLLDHELRVFVEGKSYTENDPGKPACQTRDVYSCCSQIFDT